jgi:DNA invertase Pin-like site-specific DNA recombinase
MKGQRVGYIRVSSLEQNTSRQLEGIELDKRYEDKVSAKDTDRPALQAMLDFVRQDDLVIVHSMDRLARNLDDLRRIVKELTMRGVQIQFVKENIVFKGDDSPMSNLLLSMMGAFAEFERALIRERQQEGIELAKKRGAFRGRQKCLSVEQVLHIRERVSAGVAKAKIARDLGISRATLYNYRESRTEAQG